MDASSIDRYGDCNLQIHAQYYTKCWWIECCVLEGIHVLHGLFAVNVPLCTLIIYTYNVSYKAAETLHTWWYGLCT